MTPQSEIIAAANDLAALIEAGEVPKHQAARDKAIRGALLKVQTLTRKRFRAQRKAVLDSHALANLKTVLDRERLAEAEDPKRAKLEADIAAEIGTHVYMVPVTAEQAKTYEGAVAAAVDAGGDAASDMLSTAAPQSTESFIAEYLKEGGFMRLTGDIDKTTVDNLASAIAETYESGGSFEDVVQAVKDSFQVANDFRARMIAQTELQDAYNQSILHFGREAGATQKEWITDLAPCAICIANAADGVIDLEDDFSSGDDAPPGHPNCLCSVTVHA